MDYRNENRVDARRNPIRQMLSEGTASYANLKQPEIENKQLMRGRRRQARSEMVGRERGKPDFSGSFGNAQQLAALRAVDREARLRGI